MQNLKNLFLKNKLILFLFLILLFFIFIIFWQKKQENQEEISTDPNEITNNFKQFENKTEFKIAIIGDTHYKKDQTENFEKAVKFIEKQNVDLVFTTGDNISSCEKNECKDKVKKWRKGLNSLKSKTFFTLGNHDLSEDENENKKLSENWTKNFNFPENGPENYKELVYSFDYGNTHFVILQSNLKEHFIDDNQLNWLENDLKNNKKEHTFIFFHESAFPIKDKIGESLDVKSEQRDKLWKIIDNYNVSAVFSGHEHLHSRRLIDEKVFPQAKNKVYQFIVGNTNYFDHEPPKEKSVEGLEFVKQENVFLILEIKNNNLVLNLFSVEGNLLDSFSFK